MSEEMSDLVALFVLGMCPFYSVWLSMEFSPRSKLHLLWTIPVGFFGCFAALAIFSLVVNQADDFFIYCVGQRDIFAVSDLAAVQPPKIRACTERAGRAESAGSIKRAKRANSHACGFI